MVRPGTRFTGTADNAALPRREEARTLARCSCDGDVPGGGWVVQRVCRAVVALLLLTVDVSSSASRPSSSSMRAVACGDTEERTLHRVASALAPADMGGDRRGIGARSINAGLPIEPPVVVTVVALLITGELAAEEEDVVVPPVVNNGEDVKLAARATELLARGSSACTVKDALQRCTRFAMASMAASVGAGVLGWGKACVA